MKRIICYMLVVLTMMNQSDLIESTIAEGDRLFAPGTVEDFFKRNIRIKIGDTLQPYSFDGHAPLREIARKYADHPQQVNQKCGQAGVTTYVIGLVLRFLEATFRKAAFFIPTDNDIPYYSQDKVYPLIENSPLFARLRKSARVFSVDLMELGDARLAVRATFTKKGAKTIDSDFNVYDEVDEQNPENMAFADDRLIHSKHARRFSLSQPSLEMQGINADYMDTNQMVWLNRCGCGKWNDLVGRFLTDWESIFGKNKSQVFYRCECGKRLNSQKGTWVARISTRKDRLGFQHSHFGYEILSPAQMQARIRKGMTGRSTDRKRLYISDIGLPFATDEEQPITQALLDLPELHGDFGLQDGAAYWTYFGADQGDVVRGVFLEPTSDGRLKVVGLSKCHVVDVEAIDEAIIAFRVHEGIVDAMPNKSWSLSLALRFPGIIKIQYFKSTYSEKVEEVPGFPEGVEVVQPNRDDSLNDLVDDIKRGLFIFPAKSQLSFDQLALYEEFETQLCGLVREKVTDEYGRTLPTFKKKANNHFGMALNSARLAFLADGGDGGVSSPIITGA